MQPGLWKVHRLTLDMTPRQYKLLWMCMYCTILQSTCSPWLPGMVRLRMIHLDPNFSTPTAHTVEQRLPSWMSIEAILVKFDFEMRYLMKGLLSHGAVFVPELDDLTKALGRFRPVDRTRILEGLFKWTRRGPIDVDMKRKIHNK